jgi:hypothetical protein
VECFGLDVGSPLDGGYTIKQVYPFNTGEDKDQPGSPTSPHPHFIRPITNPQAPKETEGSVNAPGKHHMTFSPELLGALLHKYGFEDVGGDRRGTITWGGEEIPTLYMYASKRK